jgi:uncharacterized membrane protein
MGRFYFSDLVVETPADPLSTMAAAWDYGVHFSELATNASFFEVGSSKPDDATAQAVWIAWAACSGLSTLFAGTVATAVLASEKARGSVFNIYLTCALSIEAFIDLPSQRGPGRLCQRGHV